MRLVIVESPCAGPDQEARRRNRRYALACCRDCLARAEAPYASFLFFDQPGLLDDTVLAERALGIEAGLAWGVHADATVMYTDLGISSGMLYGRARAEREDRPVEPRTLPTATLVALGIIGEEL